jgi:sugar phosphate isomerase/epimerase
MKTIKGPALFLAQFAGDEAPLNSWDSITKWAADCGYKGVQIPSWDTRLFDLKKAAESRTYCDEIAGVGPENGVEITKLSTHLQERWSRKFGPGVKMDRMMKVTIQNDKTKEPFARIQSPCCA